MLHRCINIIIINILMFSVIFASRIESGLNGTGLIRVCNKAIFIQSLVFIVSPFGEI